MNNIWAQFHRVLVSPYRNNKSNMNNIENVAVEGFNGGRNKVDE
jgi:hypothetical protein